MAHATVLTPLPPPARAAARAALACAAVVLLALVPPTRSEQWPALDLGVLVAVAGLGALALSLAAAALVRGAPAPGPLVRTAALWAACGLALLLAALALAATAQTLNPRLVVEAQANTSLYLFLQPAAASVFVMAFVLAADEASLRAALGPRDGARAAAEGALTVAVAALVATLFVAGAAGPALPGPVWLALKTGAIAAGLVLLRRRFVTLAIGPRLAVAWLAVLVAFANLAVTLVVVRR